MIAYKPTTETRQQNNPISVVQSAERYAGRLVATMAATYRVKPTETYTADQFRTHVRVFPEGQFLALDAAHDRVVGLAIGMRVGYNPDEPLLERWVDTTNYG